MAAPASPRPKQEGAKGGMSFSLKMAILLGVIAFMAYANTFSNNYALDDFTVIRDNNIVTKGMSAIPQILTTPYRRGWFITTNDLYRPLSLIMFATEYQLFDGEPKVSHVMNVLVFAGCVILLFLFLDELFGKKRTGVAFFATLLFALHPIHTEVVANIKSRDELLCFFFAFLSLNMFLKYANSGLMKHLLYGIVAFFLSYLSKETVISFLFIIPFVFYFYKNENKTRSLYITISAVGVSVLFLIVRFSVLRHYDANTTSIVSFIDNHLVKAPSPAIAFATEILILGKYIALLFVPYPLVCDYSYNSVPFASLGNIWVILSLVFYIAIAVFGIMRLVKKPKDPYAFAILFFLATIALFSNIVFIIGAPMAERFVFFASVGFCLAIALIVDQFLAGAKEEEATMGTITNPKMLAIFVPVCLVFGFMVVNRNGDWLDNYTLFKTDVKKSPNDSRIAYYLGTEMVVTNAKSEGNPEVRKQIIQEASTYLKQALRIYPDYTDANASLGDAYFKLAIYDSAEHYDKRALEIDPKYTIAINNLAGVYFMTNRYEKALEVCQKAIVLNPNYVNAYANIGLCYMRMGKYDMALTNLYKAISLDPNFLSAYENLALTYKALGKEDSVRKYNLLAQPAQ